MALNAHKEGAHPVGRSGDVMRSLQTFGRHTNWATDTNRSPNPDPTIANVNPNCNPTIDNSST